MSYWTCFGFDDTHPDDLHCTHKYLGDLSNQEFLIVHIILDNYFKKNKFEGLSPKFTLEQMFGLNKDVRVLTPEDKVGDHNYLMDLFNRLDRIHKDDWPEYKPHVTTDLEAVKKPLTRYLFMKDNHIIKEWHK